MNVLFDNGDCGAPGRGISKRQRVPHLLAELEGHGAVTGPVLVVRAQAFLSEVLAEAGLAVRQAARFGLAKPLLRVAFIQFTYNQ